MEYGVRMGQELMGMNGQWAMGNGQWAFGRCLWALGDRQWAMSRWLWACGGWALGNGLVYVDKCLRGKWGVEIVERA